MKSFHQPYSRNSSFAIGLVLRASPKLTDLVLQSGVLTLTVLALAISAAGASPTSGPVKQLNVLFIVVDDLRPQLGCYGQSQMKTPNIDSLAAKGTRFNRAYCQQAVCSPSRTSLMTGLRPDSTKVYDLKTHFRTTIPGVVTLPQLFKNSGYHTQGFGKIYHGSGIEGYVPNLDDKESWSVPHTSSPGSGYGGKELNARLQQQRDKHRAEGLSDVEIIRRVKGPAWEAPDVADNSLPDGAMTEQVIETLGKLKDKPFFLAVGFLKPHLPLVAPKRYFDLYPLEQIKLPKNDHAPQDVPPVAMTNSTELRNYEGVHKSDPVSDQQSRELIRGYYAATSYVDAQVGKLIAEIDRLGLRENTIVIFWGDNGWHLREQGLWSKETNFENAARVPLIVNVPGKTGGLKTDALVELVDVYPTLCELAHLQAPDGLEGTSFARLLEDPNRPWKTAAFSQYPRPTLQQRDLMGYSIRTDRYRYTEWQEQWQNPGQSRTAARELYDHHSDPDETMNLANQPDKADVVAALSASLKGGWRAALPPKKS